MIWVLILAATAAVVFLLVRWRLRQAELERESEAKFAALIAEARVAAAPKAQPPEVVEPQHEVAEPQNEDAGKA